MRHYIPEHERVIIIIIANQNNIKLRLCAPKVGTVIAKAQSVQ